MTSTLFLIYALGALGSMAQSTDGPDSESGCEKQLTQALSRVLVTQDRIIFLHQPYAYQLRIQIGPNEPELLVTLPQDAQRVCNAVGYLSWVKAFIFSTDGGGVYLVDALQPSSIEGGVIEILTESARGFQVVTERTRRQRSDMVQIQRPDGSMGKIRITRHQGRLKVTRLDKAGA